jgi:hypothetical protein
MMKVFEKKRVKIFVRGFQGKHSPEYLEKLTDK